MRTLTPARFCLLLCTLAALAPARAADPPRADVYGDPLPDGALARLGTVRWRAGNTVATTAFLPDGKSVLTVSLDYFVQVWDRDTGKELRHFDAAGEAPANPNLPRVVFLNANGTNAIVSRDGKFLACPGRDGAVRLWDLAAGKEVCRVGEWTTSGRAQLALTADGKTLATAIYGQKITLWDTATGKELRSFGETAANSRLMPYRMGFSADGKTLVQAGIDFGQGGIQTTVVAWDAVNGKETKRVTDPAFANNSLPAQLAGISPDAKTVAMPTGGRVKLLDLADGKEARDLDGGDAYTSLHFSPDGKLLVGMTGRNDSLYVWDVASGKAKGKFGKAAGPAGVAVTAGARFTSGLSVSADGKTFAWADGPALRLVDLTTGKETNASAGHASAVRDVSFGRDGKTLLTWADDATVRRWDAASGKEIGQVAVPGKSFTFVLPSPDERTLAAGEPDGTIRLFDAATGKEGHTLRPGQPTYGRCHVFSPDSRLLAVVGASSQAVEVFDVVAGRLKHPLELPSASPTTAVPGRPAALVLSAARGTRRAFFSPDSRQVAVTDVNLVIWDVASGREERQIVLPQGAALRDAVYSPDGRTIAVAIDGGEVEVWEVASAQKRLTINPQPKADPARPAATLRLVAANGVPLPGTLAFSPDGRLLAQATDRKARLWDLHTGKEVAAFDGHRGPVLALAFAPGGKRLATASSDTTGLVWDAEPAVKKLAALAAPITQDKVEASWADLLRGDGVRAYEAVRALAGDPAKAVPFLSERVKPVTPPDPKVVTKLIADLDADEFEARESAHKQLEGFGELALARMREALKGSPSAEQRRALEELVKGAVAPSPSGERLRLVRALEALELAATPEAVKVIRAVADGAPDTLPTTQAQAILRRLGQK
jgi:WD40 repeat protein